MSDKPKEESAAPAKKKGKLPIIVALVAVLGGGGYFMTKPKGGKPAVKVIELAKAPEDIKEEFLVNLNGPGAAYLRTEISLWMSKDYHGHIEEEQAVVKDAILDVLGNASVEDMRGEKLKALKKEIAARLNAVLAEEEEHKEEPAKETHKKNQVVVKEEKKEEHPVEVPEDWDSATGPVLRILFRSKAWQ